VNPGKTGGHVVVVMRDVRTAGIRNGTIEMLISDTHQFIFIHIPRTAGMSLRAALGPFADGDNLDFSRVRWEREYPHFTAVEISQIVGEDRFLRFFKFAFVRNPWERMVSRYSYLKQFNSRPDEPINERGYYPPASLSFGEWLTGDTRNAVHPLDLRQQKDWLVRDTSDLAVDFVGHFENLSESIDMINKRLGTNIMMPHANRSEHTNYRQYYTEGTRDYVGKLFAKDIETWDYKY
jgi:chondroitin 4-sulfotransferase 11